MADRLVAPKPEPLTKECLEDATLFATRADSLELWPRNANIAEVGVAAGWFTRQILAETQPAMFDAYDTFILHQFEILWGQKTTDMLENLPHRDYYEKKFAEPISEGRMRVFEGDSSTRLSASSPDFYDLIYIDGNHSYDGVRRDVDASLRAIKDDGILVFNDYVFYDRDGNQFGVMPIVHDLCLNHGWKVLYLSLQAELFCDIALVRR